MRSKKIRRRNIDEKWENVEAIIQRATEKNIPAYQRKYEETKIKAFHTQREEDEVAYAKHRWQVKRIFRQEKKN